MTTEKLAPWDLDNLESGPVEKFYLLKIHGAALRKAGYHPDDLRPSSRMRF